ncbi:hypothetical protein EJ03DRAFT_353760 [Teratosphaeria nubilosa]|uniref:Uncharacterized protein n=1 Tax=Teratosphaeria nubilosa TaxID=161662 RepID=A0A6G1L153_9PEZI|nr:hypothetical protein EJ03DRAFT_353760 [Teratosphaeria nubilosa]
MDYASSVPEAQVMPIGTDEAPRCNARTIHMSEAQSSGRNPVDHLPTSTNASSTSDHLLLDGTLKLDDLTASMQDMMKSPSMTRKQKLERMVWTAMKIVHDWLGGEWRVRWDLEGEADVDLVAFFREQLPELVDRLYEHQLQGKFGELRDNIIAKREKTREDWRKMIENALSRYFKDLATQTHTRQTSGLGTQHFGIPSMLERYHKKSNYKGASMAKEGNMAEGMLLLCEQLSGTTDLHSVLDSVKSVDLAKLHGLQSINRDKVFSLSSVIHYQNTLTTRNKDHADIIFDETDIKEMIEPNPEGVFLIEDVHRTNSRSTIKSCEPGDKNFMASPFGPPLEAKMRPAVPFHSSKGERESCRLYRNGDRDYENLPGDHKARLLPIVCASHYKKAEFANDVIAMSGPPEFFPKLEQNRDHRHIAST